MSLPRRLDSPEARRRMRMGVLSPSVSGWILSSFTMFGILGRRDEIVTNRAIPILCSFMSIACQFGCFV